LVFSNLVNDISTAGVTALHLERTNVLGPCSGILRRALLDAKVWFGGVASWVGNALGDILKSEAAQKTIGTVTEATTKAAIESFVK
jgi:hypothetical protein